MKRPVVYALLFFIIGIICGQHSTYWWSAVLFLFSCLLSFAVYKKTKYTGALTLICFVLLGIVLAVAEILPKNKSLFDAAAENKTAKISGSVVESTFVTSPCAKVVTDTITVENESYTDSINIFVYSDKEYKPGDKISVVGTLSLPQRKKNPTDFNTEAYYRYNKVFCALNAVNVVKTGEFSSLKVYLRKIRQKFSEIYDEILPNGKAATIKAVILGETENIDSNTYQKYKNSGIVHILAISGLHISVLAEMLTFLLKKLFGRKTRYIVLVFLLLYCIMTGCAISTVRAALMFALSCLGSFFYKKGDTAFLACFILLAYSPSYIYNTGFCFSFACVFAIVAVNDVLIKYIKDSKKRAKISVFAMLLAVTLACKPLSVYSYYTFTPYDPIANFIVVPLMLPVVVIGMLSGVVGLFSLSLARFCIGIVYVILSFVDTVTEFIARLPHSIILTGGISLFMMLSVYFIYIIIYNYLMKEISLRVFLSGLTLASIIFLTSFLPQRAVIFPYVGNGDCAIVRYGRYTAFSDMGSGFGNNAGEKVIEPYMNYIGSTKIDDVFISHLDRDHIDGLIQIAGKIPINNVYINKNYVPTEYSHELFDALTKNNIKINYIEDGFSKKIGTLTWSAFIADSYDSNSSSVVYKLDTDKTSFLFTGDIDKTVEEKLLERNINCDVLKVAHHGSNTSSCEDFLKKASPKKAIITAGYKNTYGHPDKEVVLRLKKLGIEYKITGYDGAVMEKF